MSIIHVELHNTHFIWLLDCAFVFGYKNGAAKSHTDRLAVTI